MIQVIIGCSIILLRIYFMGFSLSGRRRFKMLAKIPQPNLSLLPIIGHAHHLIGKNSEDLLNIILSHEITPTIYWIAYQEIVFISEPEDIRIVLNHPNTITSDVYKFGASVTGEGLFTAPTEKWKKHRKLIHPSFAPKIINGFLPIFLEQIDIFLNILSKESATFDFYEKVSLCSLDVICKTAMDVDFKAQTTNSNFAASLERILEIVITRFMNILLHPDFIYRFTNLYKEEKKIQAYLHEVVLKVIEDKRAKKKLEQPEDGRQKIFLDFLLDIADNGQVFSNDDLRDEVNTFIVAGVDTTSTVSSFVFLMLGMFPDVQEKVYNEAIEILGFDKEVELEDLARFKYTECVIKETMRIFTLVPIALRQTTGDIKLDSCVIPNKTTIAVCFMGTHRSANFFPDPLKFDPERFRPEEAAKRHPYAFLPFSAGPKICLGAKYSYMFLKALVAKTIRKFKIETNYKNIEEIRVKEDLLLKSVLGYPVRMISREITN